MSRLSLTISLVMIPGILLFALPPATVAAQQKRVSYGPVIRSYLTGIEEELNELEYQLQHQEISRADYERAKSRLVILRRFVERYAKESRQDLIPEYQVLADDELGTLGLSREFRNDELFAGAKLERQWKIVAVQFAGGRNLTRFLVLERVWQPAEAGTGGIVREGKLGKLINPHDVIETIVVPGERPQLATQQPQTRNRTVIQTAAADPAPPAETTTQTIVAAAQKSALQNVRILHIYLPEYTEKAREKKIEGEVVVRALFQRDGKIRIAKVEKGLGHGLDERATEAVKRIGFFPAQLDGKDVDAQVRIVFGFKLEKVSVYVGEAESIPSAKEAVKGERY